MGRLTDWLLRKGESRTQTHPASGKAIVLSDLHGHYGDWSSFRRQSQVFERLEAGEDLYLLITGDIPDVKRHITVDPTVPEDGDVQIVEDLIAARESLGDRGARIVYLEGNHDFHVGRIVREVARWFAFDRGLTPPKDTDRPELVPAQFEAYCAYYRESYGDAVFDNNIGPYDMVARARPELVEFLESGPILAVMEHAGVLVTHAGPARRASWKPSNLRKAIDRSNRSRLRLATPEEYYETPYHQLLNNRFRNRDYSLRDLESFVELYGAELLVTGHTPHPYLIDFDKRQPLEGCEFIKGLGVIGGRQVVLCSSFGALHSSWKTYLELDLTHRYASAEDLHAAGAVKQMYPAEELPVGASLPGADIVLGEAL